MTRYPSFLGFVGLMFAILFSVMGISSFMESQKIGDKPQNATLASIVATLKSKERYWVTIQDGSFDCRSIYHERVGSSDYTEIFLKNPDESIIMLVTYTEKLSCTEIENLPIQGVAYAMSGRHRSLLEEAGRLSRYSVQTDYVELCTVCSQSNSKLLVILSLILTLLSLSLYPLTLWAGNSTGKSKAVDFADESSNLPKDA